MVHTHNMSQPLYPIIASYYGAIEILLLEHTLPNRITVHYLTVNLITCTGYCFILFTLPQVVVVITIVNFSTFL